MTRHPRYADIVGTLALVLALGGTAAYAAQSLPKHSVGHRQLKPDAVNTRKIKDGQVTAADLANGAVGPAKLGAGSVGSGALADGSVNSAKIANHSLALADLVGTDVGTTLAYSLAPDQCTVLTRNVPGAQVGQAVLLTLTGAVAPGDVVFQPARVTGTNSVSVDVCNVGAATATVAGLGVRVVTFG